LLARHAKSRMIVDVHKLHGRRCLNNRKGRCRVNSRRGRPARRPRLRP
jgi:hypothetical protein